MYVTIRTSVQLINTTSMGDETLEQIRTNFDDNTLDKLTDYMARYYVLPLLNPWPLSLTQVIKQRPLIRFLRRVERVCLRGISQYSTHARSTERFLTGKGIATVRISPT